VWLRAASLWPGCPLVTVSSADGGVGRSTLVAAVGGVLALACPQPVIALDFSGRAWGGLVHRVGRRHDVTLWDAYSRIDMLTHRSVVEQFMQLGPTGMHALVGEVSMTSRRRPTTGQETAAVLSRLRALYHIALLDLPVAETSGAWRALSWGSAPVLVARATSDSLQHTMRLVAQLRGVGLTDLADKSVLVVMASSPHVASEVRASERQAKGVVGDLIRVPYDVALAKPSPVDPRALRKATRGALITVVEAVLERCPTNPDAAIATRGAP